VTPVCRIKRSHGKLIIGYVAVILIIIGFSVLKVTGNPFGVQDQGRAELKALSAQSGFQDHTEGEGISTAFDKTSSSLQGSDALDKLRSSRSPALEREIVGIARASVARVVLGKRPGSEETDSVCFVSSSLRNMQAGVFVTIIIDDKVRGCMGRIHPAEASLWVEIARAAEMAATMDMRHPPISAEDLPNLDFCVSVVGRVRRESPDVEVNPRLEGILVKTGGRSGVILPGEARTSAYQRKWAKREAGIEPGVPFELYVFETERFGKTLPVRG